MTLPRHSRITLGSVICAAMVTQIACAPFSNQPATAPNQSPVNQSPVPAKEAPAASGSPTESTVTGSTATVSTDAKSTDAGSTANAKPQAKRVSYAPHVTIDWSVPQVEVEAKVVLREGLIELLVCGEGTKEHESILATPAKARHIYEALGLIGAEPGAPAQYDLGNSDPGNSGPGNDAYTPASGQRLALEIQYPIGDGARTVAAHEWLATSETHQPIAPPHWFFCGSRIEGDRFLANNEGTIACVVDFDSALIALGEKHSASNDELWLAANTESIPAKGTACTLILRTLDVSPINVQLTPENYFSYNGSVIDALQLDALIKERIKHNPDQKVGLSAAPDTPNNFTRVAGRCIIGSGIKPENLKLTLNPEEAESAGEDASPARSPPAP